MDTTHTTPTTLELREPIIAPEPRRKRSYYNAEFRAMRMRDLPTAPPLMDTPELAERFFRSAMESAAWWNPHVEQLACVGLSTRRRVLGFWLVSCGTLDTILVHPREIFRTAILLNSASLVIAHNHPSGDPTPSEADIKITRDLIRAGQLLKIDVTDHIIIGQRGWSGHVGGRDYTSLRELGYFYN